MGHPSERRRHIRTPQRFDGSWRGASGANRCTIADVSIGGCFVQTLATPSRGEQTTVTIEIPNGAPIALKGRAVYTEAGMGFAMMFDELDPNDLATLQALIDSIIATKTA